ncbi:unnamed protein product [Parnassius apollo]|uniref:(apollo) hypothetical protein n=1 Tax=Parnassius apollo TaxID=110799 RepID=A0A8S3XLM2_PARAO|nr:unnamed protein product [Parnassius apollo]
MDNRAAKLAAARQKLKTHQEKKLIRSDASHIAHQLVKETTEKNVSPNIGASEANEIISLEIKNIGTKNIPEGPENNLSVTEMLISNKTKLEAQVMKLETQLTQLQCNYNSAMEQQNVYEQTISRLEMELQSTQEKYGIYNEEICLKNKMIADLQNKNSALTDENNNLLEQMEFTKTILTVKESENFQLSNQISVLQNQLDAAHLQIRQLTNDSDVNINHNNEDNPSNSELNHKISNLEQQLHALKKERDNINQHYEHYVNELNMEIKALSTKNDALNQEIQQLYNRENSLVDQISDMEIRLQSYHVNKVTEEGKNANELQEKLKTIETKFQELSDSYAILQTKYSESQARIEVLSKSNKIDYDQDNIKVSKLNADITSDKVAAQRAMEQNKKLKTDLEELEFAFVKMSKDKLDLTEKLTHEKHLTKELMLKLAEIEENTKSLHSKLMAKDEEMIRLQNSYRLLEKKYETLAENKQQLSVEQHNHVQDQIDINCNQEKTIHDPAKIHEGHKELIESSNEETKLSIAKEDAMLKLQERFLNIMDEVANLSDEKHRLEHIILQLQNETDTVCEYIALYQQQRSLLKKRDEDRSEQIKMFQKESDKLRRQLQDLNNLLLRFANDKNLETYLQDESRKVDLAKERNVVLVTENVLVHATQNWSPDRNKQVSYSRIDKSDNDNSIEIILDNRSMPIESEFRTDYIKIKLEEIASSYLDNIMEKNSFEKTATSHSVKTTRPTQVQLDIPSSQTQKNNEDRTPENIDEHLDDTVLPQIVCETSNQSNIIQNNEIEPGSSDFFAEKSRDVSQDNTECDVEMGQDFSSGSDDEWQPVSHDLITSIENEESTSKSDSDDGDGDDNIPLALLCRKRKKGYGPYQRKLRKERTEKRRKGEEYVTAKGKCIPKRYPGGFSDNCRAKCQQKLKKINLNQLYIDYRELPSRKAQKRYLSGLIKIKPKERTRRNSFMKNREVTVVYNID